MLICDICGTNLDNVLGRNTRISLAQASLSDPTLISIDVCMGCRTKVIEAFRELVSRLTSLPANKGTTDAEKTQEAGPGHPAKHQVPKK